MAGSIVMSGFLGSSFTVKPWIRRLVTRSFAIIPAVVVIIVLGDRALNNLLILSQIILSLQLPFAVWPLVYFTSKKEIMKVSFHKTRELSEGETESTIPMLATAEPAEIDVVDYSNSKLMMASAIFVSFLLTAFNIILIVEVGLGNS